MIPLARQDTWTTSEMTEQVTHDKIAPKGFLEKMRRALADDALDVRWNQKKGRWGLFRVVPRFILREGVWAWRDFTIPVTTIRNPDGSYRGLDDRVIDWLKAADSRHIDLSALLAEMQEQQRLADLREDARCTQEIADRLNNNPKGVRDWIADLPIGLGRKAESSIVIDGFKEEKQ